MTDSPHRVPAAEASPLIELGLALVVDLRSAAELDELGAGELPLPTVHMPFLGDARRSDLGAIDNLGDAYVAMLETSGSNIGNVIGRLAEPGSLPALVHCTAGKDRTGLVVGLLLSAIGVTDAEVAADYARTSHVTGTAMRWLAANEPTAHATLSSRPAWVLGAEEATIRRVLDHVRAHHGTAAGWLATVGVDDAAVAALAEALLEPA
jgi:protein-tyrosine phosphatase